MKTILVLLSALAFGAALRSQDDAPSPGHSNHGEVFNEGPRQAAVLIRGTGEVHLAVTTASEEARRFFDQGVGQLHGYWFFEAERSFRQAAALDPDCAMAYWGMAMANFKNDTRGKKFIDEAVARKDKASDREKLWIDGLAAYFEDPKADAKKRLRDYVRSLEKILLAHPDEVEAEAFLLHQVFYNSGKDLPVSSHYAMNLLAEKILTKHPKHPANHFQIHLWDKTEPERALAAAADCGPAAPAIAHMWHMPGHIYSGLKRHADAAWHQEASARVDHAHMMRHHVVPDQIHNFAHNNEWWIRNLNHLGQFRRSVALAKNMISLPRLAKFKKLDGEDVYDPDRSSWQYGRQRLRDSLVRFEAWEELIALSGDGTDKAALLHPDGQSITDVEHHRYVGLAKFESGDLSGGHGHLAELEKRLSEKQAERDKAVADAEKKATESKKDAKAIGESKKAAAKTFEKAVSELENPVNELRVCAALCADPPDTENARELLPKLKDLAKWRHAQLWQRAGGGEEAIKLAGEAVSGGKNEVLPLAAQVRILHANGRKDEARAAFAELRTVAHLADEDLAAFAPLASIAREFGFPDRWRLAPETPGDIGERPGLDSLGPAFWSPPPAPPLSLPDAENRETPLFVPRGRPRLVIFYLGKGCSHCMEQLNAFAPLASRYAEAGIDLVAVGTDTPEGLKGTVAEGEGGDAAFPFPLLSDATLDAFKAFRAYDDFEGMPLHGTFLIDSEGGIRWQETGYEPFMRAEWLLEECRRLLAADEAVASDGAVAVSPRRH